MATLRRPNFAGKAIVADRYTSRANPQQYPALLIPRGVSQEQRSDRREGRLLTTASGSPSPLRIRPKQPSAGPECSHPLSLGDASHLAGMTDTLRLDCLISWALDRGASIRLIGDDQQLGAISSGSILRDITTTHGTARLGEVMRFTDPAEAHASLALRDSDPAELG